MRKIWIRFHFIHAILFTLLLASGACLYITQTRTWFNQMQFPLVAVHLVIAVVYLFIVLIGMRSLFRYLFKKPLIKKFNGSWTLLFAVLWILSGSLMYFQSSMPVFIRNQAVIIHDWSTFLFLPWVLTHSIGHFSKMRINWPKWWRGREPLPEIIQENRLKRRDFLKFIGVGFLFVALGGFIKWFIPTLWIPSEGKKRRGYFRIYNVTNDFPHYKETEWSLTIDGNVDKPTTLRMADMPRFPSTTIVDDFHCVTGWSVHRVELKGVKVKDIFSQLELTTQGNFVTAYSGDETYYDSFTIDQLLDEGAMLVFEIDGQPLKQTQGYPCRLYHPSMYGYKSVKWLNRLEFTDDREIGYWQKSGGYDLNGYL